MASPFLTSGPAQERLLFLLDRFRRGLPERVAAIGSALDAAAPGGSLEEVARLCHQLAGTAGTYGLTTITPIAREGEALCAGLEPRPERMAALYRVLGALQAAAGVTGQRAES